MQPLWYGDRRDRVKWGALFHLASRFELSPIIQVAYWRDKTLKTLQIGTRRETVHILGSVWNHFSNLRNIERLGQAAGKLVIVIDESFLSRKRREYVKQIIEKIRRYSAPKLLFLDPDTGIQHDGSAGAEHASITDVREFWAALNRNDVLAAYPHANRRTGWIDKKQDQLSLACNGSRVSAIRSSGISQDVALLWTRKSH